MPSSTSARTGRKRRLSRFRRRLAHAFENGQAERGVLSAAAAWASRWPPTVTALRAAPCHDHLSARLARAHNDANVLGLGARLIGVDPARDCLRIFLATDFEGGRHERRVAKMS